MTTGVGPSSARPATELDTGLIEPGRAIAVSPHHLASRAGADLMAAGGSAVDGAIAINAVLSVVLPDTCGPGGDLFALIHVPGEPTPEALNASGRAGSGAHASDLRDAGHQEVPLRSPWSITVPGCVDGWETLHERHGRLPLATVLAPAIALARDGFATSSELSSSLHRVLPLIASQPSAAPLYPGGKAPDAGDIVVRPHFAATLAAVASAGREAFYGGPPGEGITAATDGMITSADLERRQAEWIDPVGMEVFGMTGWTIPPNSQGYLTLAAAHLFERLSPQRTSTAASTHLAIEAYRALAWERDDLVADATTSPLSPGEMLDPARLEQRLLDIDADAAGVWPRSRNSPGGTAYMCARDQSGMGVSLIQSNFHGIGSGRSAGATGVFLHNRGAGFTLEAGHPNELIPGRRPLHTLSPTLWTDTSGLRALLGTRGGQYQPQLLLQVAADLWWYGMDPAEAQAAARWIADGWGRGETSRLQVEARMALDIRAGLEARGHQVHRAGDWEAGWGPVSLIVEDGDGPRGIADPRVSTAAAIATA
jgi:gamma-glutamyltranspeptidase/glutathione hydrolase